MAIKGCLPTAQRPTTGGVVTAPDVQQLGDAVLIQGAALRDLYLCLHKGIPGMSANGHSPVLLHAVELQVHRALMSARGHQVAECVAAQTHSKSQSDDDWMTVSEAATELGVSQRHVRRLARSCQLGQRVGATWAINRGAALALAREREKGNP